MFFTSCRHRLCGRYFGRNFYLVWEGRVITESSEVNMPSLFSDNSNDILFPMLHFLLTRLLSIFIQKWDIKDVELGNYERNYVTHHILRKSKKAETNEGLGWWSSYLWHNTSQVT